MEFRRALTMQKTLSLLLVQAKATGGPAKPDQDDDAAWRDVAKAMSRKLRPTESIYRVGPDIFGLVLPMNGFTECQAHCRRSPGGAAEVRAKYTKVFDVTPHNYPQDVQSAHELEDIVKSLLPEQQEWEVPLPATK